MNDRIDAGHGSANCETGVATSKQRRKPWSTPTVVLSEAQQTEHGIAFGPEGLYPASLFS